MTKLKRLYKLLQLINLLHKQPSKSIEQIAEILDTSSRSVYRYIELLELTGFDVQKNSRNRYFIEPSENTPLSSFTDEESEFLSQLLRMYGEENQLSKSVKSKLATTSLQTITTKHIVNARLSNIISNLNKAIESKSQVVLLKYQSISSQTIEDRLVEPIAFSKQYKVLFAFEVASEMNKIYIVDRINGVEISSTKFKFEDKHRVEELDVFGFGPNSENKMHPVHLELTLKAKILLTEEYPLSLDHIKPSKNKDRYIFKCEVNDLRPIKRFVKGLSKDIVEIEL